MGYQGQFLCFWRASISFFRRSIGTIVPLDIDILFGRTGSLSIDGTEINY